MDGPNVNLKCLQKVQGHRCGLHTIHGTFKAGVQSTDWMLKEVSNSAYYHILNDSLARRDDYQTITGSSVFPLNFYSTQ